MELPLLDKSFYRKIPYSVVKKQLALPIQFQNSDLIVALADINNREALENLAFFIDEPLIAQEAPQEELIRAIDRCYHHDAHHTKQVLATLPETETENRDLSEDLLEDKDQAPVIQLLNAILAEAFLAKASDIHFEPSESGLIVRFRIDGLLQKRFTPPKDSAQALITRLKVMAHLDIAQARLPQDGRIKIRMGGQQIDLRVSTLPVMGGERVVLRILDQGSLELDLSLIGMSGHLLTSFKHLLSASEGMLLVTGPTGSGKTTTLYSAIASLNQIERNIMTIEDPVEYKLSGISQMAVNPKINLNFASGLRHILRQDPDIILVGEIRDSETASIAVQAALTGHLMLSTLHTNDAPSAVPRLIDMGIEPYLLNSSLIGVLAQRLVRLLCPHCKVSKEPTPSERKWFKKEKIEELFHQTGCPSCQGIGFKGRTAIYELMPITPLLREQMAKTSSSRDLYQVAIEEGMSPLRKSGLDLVLKGLTTLEEVLTATQ